MKLHRTQIKLPKKALIIFGICLLGLIGVNLVNTSKANALSSIGCPSFCNTIYHPTPESGTFTSGSGTQSDPYIQNVGSSFKIQMGYTMSNSVVNGLYAYDWTEWQDSDGQMTPNSGIQVDSANTDATSEQGNCYTMILPQNTSYYSPSWQTTNKGGIACSDYSFSSGGPVTDKLCVSWSPSNVNCPPPNTANGNYPDPYGTASFIPGHAVIFYQRGPDIQSNNVFDFSVEGNEAGTFCIRNHLSVSGSNFSAGNFAANDLPYVDAWDNSTCTYFKFVVPAPPPTYISPTDSVSCSQATANNPGGELYSTPSAGDTTGADSSAFSGYGGAVPPLPPAQSSTFIDPGPPITYPTVSSWSTSQSGKTVSTRTIINVSDSAGNTLASDVVGSSFEDGSSGTKNVSNQLYLSNTWNYTPQGQNITYTFTYEELILAHLKVPYRGSNSTAEYWVAYSSKSGTITCYNATCTLSVSGNLQNGGVEAGQSNGMIVTAQITNTGSLSLPTSLAGNPFQFNQGDTGPGLGNGSDQSFSYNIGPIDPGGTYTLTFYLTAPQNNPANNSDTPYTQTIAGHPAYSDGFDFGTSCSSTANVYQQFTLTGNALPPILTPSTEAPTAVNNDVYVAETGAPVSETVTGNLSETPYRGSSVDKGDATASGPFDNGTDTCLFQASPPNNISGCSATYNGTYGPNSPPQAGDQYCASIDVPFTAGWVGPAGDFTNTTAGTPQRNCSNVNNRPFFKVVNGNIIAGGGFSASTGGSCSGGGTLAGWNNNTNGFDYGSSSQLSNLALLAITGVASAQTNPTNPPEGLNFANSSLPAGYSITTDPYHPSLGGAYSTSGTNCLVGESAPTTANPNSSTIITGLARSTPSKALKLSGRTIPVGFNQSYIVKNESVYITGNITYNGSNGGWSKPSDVPSFVLDVCGGNIYLDPGVTELDGLYIAEPSCASGGGTGGGTIYTCGSFSGTTGSPVTASNLFATCNNQLSVYGNFVANQVNLMRTFGSLRDETPKVTGTPGTGGTAGATKNPFLWLSDTISNTQGDPGLRVDSGYDCANTYEPSEPNGAGNANAGSVSGWDGFGGVSGGFGSPKNYIGNFLCTTKLPDASNADGTTGAQVQIGWTCANGANPSGCTSSNYASLSSDYCTGDIGPTIEASPWNYPTSMTWDDNQICSNYPISFKLSSSDPTDTTQYCTEMNDPRDTQGGGGGIFTGFASEKPYICITAYQAATSGSTTTTAQVANPCSNAGIQESSQTCAAEVFYQTPELYLSKDAVAPPSNGVTQYDAITTLPPVL